MPMRADVLLNKEQTGRAMHRVVGRFARDLDSFGSRWRGRLVPLSKLPLGAYHSLIRRIRYKRDRSPVEVVGRPSRLLGGEFRKGLDCKKKAILLAAWAARNYVPYRFVASSRRKDKRYHHVFPQFQISGQWVNVDATYRQMRLGQVKRVTAAEVI